MSDQAETLRRLVRNHDNPAPPKVAKILVFTSGKGGVGTSNIALNLALALGESGRAVTLVDADFGLANLDLLVGAAPPCDLGDVFSGDRPLTDATLDGPNGVRILAGAHGTRTLADALIGAPQRLASELAGLAAGRDFVLIDAGSGLNPAIATLAAAADSTVVVTTPEPTSMADAHATLRRLGSVDSIHVIANQASSRREATDCLDRLAATSRQFLGLVVSPLGYVRYDPRVPRAVRGRKPFLLEFPRSAASRDVRRLAESLSRQPREASGLLRKLTARWRVAG